MSTVAAAWEDKRTDETREVETTLNRAGWPHCDAYRYNTASIRVRVIDNRFVGLSKDKRLKLVEPILATLPRTTQCDIFTLHTFTPAELLPNSKVFRARELNAEFELPEQPE